MPENRRIVIKIGTSTLTGGSVHLDHPRVLDLVRQIAELRSNDELVCLVSSGAIAAGKEVLDFPQLQKSIPAKQMLAAVGQPRLMNLYDQFFGIYQHKVAQILLTREDISDRKRYINARNTLSTLLEQGVIPIINENDSVATEELHIGDNDNLSAMVANLIEADLLILLTDQEGLFTADPREKRDAQLIQVIEGKDIPEDIWQAAGGAKNSLGTGGMITKLEAAETARRAGTKVVIAQGDLPNVLTRIADGEEIGTLILPTVDTLESRKRYMLTSVGKDTAVVIDEGAKKAIQAGGSLLPVGIKNVKGDFERGDIVNVIAENEDKVALGFVNYSCREIESIKGCQSEKIEALLGFVIGDEVIHHNNMTLLV